MPSIFYRTFALARMQWPCWRSFSSRILHGRGLIIAPNWQALTVELMQLGFKAYWQAYLEDHVEGLLRDRDSGGISQIRADVRQFLDAWQDPVTGYWGAWYRVGDRLYRTTDLSITFHLISYLQGDVQHWPQIIETTFNIANEPYPYGWRYGLSSNNHNNYDVVKIFRYGMASHDRGATRSRPRSDA